MNHRTLRLLRSFVFAGLVTALAIFAINRGAEPTTTAVVAILALLLFGGFDVHEILAAHRALRSAEDAGNGVEKADEG